MLSTASKVKLAPRMGSLMASTCTQEFYSSTGHGSRPNRSGKPPNVLLYSGNNEDLFSHAKMTLSNVIDPEGCIVYRLKSAEAQGRHWMDNTRALVVLERPDRALIVERMAEFAVNGNILLWSDKDEVVECLKGATDIEKGYIKSDSNVLLYRRSPQLSDDKLLRSAFASFGVSLRPVSDIKATPLQATPGYLLCQNEQLKTDLEGKDIVSLRPVHLGSEIKSEEATRRIKFVPNAESSVQEATKADNDVIKVFTKQESKSFDSNLYYSHLCTSDFGRFLIHVPVAKTAFDFLGEEPVFTDGSVAVVPDRQLQGKGRGGNEWISPPGCAMFCLQFSVPQSSPLGQRAPILCHLVALAIVHAVKTLSGRRRDDVDVGIKWPNDIYVGGRDKIGGILLFNRCTPDGNMLFSVGVGLNLDNALPTVSLNGWLKSKVPDLETIKREALLAEIFNSFELVLSQYQKGCHDTLMDQYYRYWLHNDQNVKVRTADGEDADVVVSGVDEFGFLVVREAKSGAERTVHPDGNSFDMMSGLIFPKTR